MSVNLPSLTERVGWVPWDNCSYPAILDYPDPGFPTGFPSVTISALILLYCYVALSEICDGYFVPAIRVISDGCKCTGDIAGAVLLASASSMPELALNLMATFTVDDADIVAGTIVGSAVFNTLAVPAICSLCICQGKICEAWPVTRDALMSAASLVVLMGVLADGRIYWSEALFMLLIYAAYVISLNADCKARSCFSQIFHGTDEALYSKSPLLANASSFSVYHKEAELGLAEDASKQTPPHKRNFLTRIFQPLIAPVNWSLKYTIPSPVNGRWAFVCSVISLAWIAGLIYLISWMITIIGYYLNIPDSLMGLTVLAVGLGMPDVLGSVSVARQGQSSMAICNALGANTFNILVCLGLPWLIKSALFGTRDEVNFSNSADYDVHFVKIDSEGVEFSVLIMLVALCLAYGTLAASKFSLNRVVGLTCINLYAIYVVIVSLIEFNVFFLSNLPLCNIKDYYNA